VGGGVVTRKTQVDETEDRRPLRSKTEDWIHWHFFLLSSVFCLILFCLLQSF
jgi:hypothetical protein